MSSRDPSIPTPPPQPEHQLHHVMNVICHPKIVSRIYKRAAASSRHCIFSECEHTERLLVPSIIKEMLLLDHKLYIPASTRICSHHLNMGAWGELQFHYNDFTGSQMDDMMSIMDRASRRQFDFSNIREMHPHLCHYWLGINPEQFYQLLSHIPQLTHEVPCPSVALSILISSVIHIFEYPYLSVFFLSLTGLGDLFFKLVSSSHSSYSLGTNVVSASLSCEEEVSVLLISSISSSVSDCL
ncbi:hypothetical protein ACJJTC_016443 [Scirpophaga incertulas]